MSDRYYMGMNGAGVCLVTRNIRADNTTPNEMPIRWDNKRVGDPADPYAGATHRVSLFKVTATAIASTAYVTDNGAYDQPWRVPIVSGAVNIPNSGAVALWICPIASLGGVYYGDDYRYTQENVVNHPADENFYWTHKSGTYTIMVNSSGLSSAYYLDVNATTVSLCHFEKSTRYDQTPVSWTAQDGDYFRIRLARYAQAGYSNTLCRRPYPNGGKAHYVTVTVVRGGTTYSLFSNWIETTTPAVAFGAALSLYAYGISNGRIKSAKVEYTAPLVAQRRPLNESAALTPSPYFATEQAGWVYRGNNLMIDRSN